MWWKLFKEYMVFLWHQILFWNHCVRQLLHLNPIRRICTVVFKYHFFMFCCFGPVVFYCMDIKTHIFLSRYYYIISLLENIYHMTFVLIWLKSNIGITDSDMRLIWVALFDSLRGILIEIHLGFHLLLHLLKEWE